MLARLVLSVLAIAGRPSTPTDLDEVRRELDAGWQSLQTIEFECREYLLDEANRPRKGLSELDFHFAYQAGGRWAYATWQVDLEGNRRPLEDTRQDGRKQYQVFARKGHPDVIDFAQISTQTSTADTYDGGMQVALWLWIPGGKPPIAHLRSGGRLEIERTLDGRETVVLVSSHKGHPLRCELDPEHEWLPRRVLLGDFAEYVATDFRRDNGRWFPSEGFGITRLGPSRAQRDGFRVTSLAINRGIFPSTFQMPRLAPGVIVQDAAGKGEIVGGQAARETLEREYPSAPAAQAAPGDTGSVGGPPDARVAIWLLAAVGVGLLTMAVFLWYRQQRG
jgi:hypothetical protein